MWIHHWKVPLDPIFDEEHDGVLRISKFDLPTDENGHLRSKSTFFGIFSNFHNHGRLWIHVWKVPLDPIFDEEHDGVLRISKFDLPKDENRFCPLLSDAVKLSELNCQFFENDSPKTQISLLFSDP